MKKKYEQPRLEVTEFRFSEHIANASSGPCKFTWDKDGEFSCTEGIPEKIWSNNLSY
jgi:hypothetical protein